MADWDEDEKKIIWEKAQFCDYNNEVNKDILLSFAKIKEKRNSFAQNTFLFEHFQKY